jgi:peptide/nickel transport system substrate-binding protein
MSNGARVRTAGIAFALAVSATFVSLGTGALTTSADAASSNGGSNTTKVQTAAATKDLSAATWWIWYRPLASVDPVKYNDYPEDLIIPNMCESLFKELPGKKTVGNLASSYTQPNPLTVILHLQKNVKFWDGTPMTSADVVYSLKRNFVTANASIYAYTTAFENVKAVTANGPDTVTITFKVPNLTFIPELASLGGAVVEQAATVKSGANFGTPQGKLECTGPFKLSSWNGSSSLVMVKNTNYWNTADTAKIKKLTFVWPQDSGQVASAFEAGTFAGGFDILPSDILSLGKTGAGKLYVGPNSQAMEISAMIVVGTKGAIANEGVRQAFSLSINRPQLIKAVQYGVGTPAYTFAAPGYFSYDKGTYTTAYNKIAAAYTNQTKAHAQAVKLVKAAGAVAKLPIVLSVLGGDADAANQAAVVQQSAAAVGLNVKLKVVTAAQYGALFSDPASRKGIDLVQTTNYDQDPDPLALYNDIALPNAISNFDSYDNPAIVKLLTEANGETNLAKRATLVVQAQSLIMKYMPWIPLTFNPGTAFVAKGICGVTLDFSQMMGPWAASVGGC